MYSEEGALFLAVIDGIDSNRWCDIHDVKILRNTDEIFSLEDINGISERDIKKNFGNITLEEWEKQYPEWTF